MARYSALVNKFTLLTENFSSKVIEQLVDYVEEEYKLISIIYINIFNK